MSKTISEVRRDFYPAMRECLEKLKRESEREFAADQFSTKAKLASNQLMKFQEKSAQIFEFRMGKILDMALRAAEGSRIDTARLTVEEQEIYDRVFLLLKERRSVLLEGGKARPVEAEEPSMSPPGCRTSSSRPSGRRKSRARSRAACHTGHDRDDASGGSEADPTGRTNHHEAGGGSGQGAGRFRPPRCSSMVVFFTVPARPFVLLGPSSPDRREDQVEATHETRGVDARNRLRVARFRDRSDDGSVVSSDARRSRSSRA